MLINLSSPFQLYNLRISSPTTSDGFGVGEHVQLWGRIQSREYQKQVGDEEYETRVAYEISVSKLECVEESNEITAACVIDEEDKKE